MRPRAPGTPEISWQVLQPYLRISVLPKRASPPPVSVAARSTSVRLGRSHAIDSDRRTAEEQEQHHSHSMPSSDKRPSSAMRVYCHLV